MYLQLVFPLLWVVGAFGRPERCAYEPWGQCKRTASCPVKNNAPFKINSYHAAPSQYDGARERMKLTMEYKREQSAARQACRAAGTCPEYAYRTTEGAIPCVNGFAGAHACRNIDQVAFISMEQLDLEYNNAFNLDGNDLWAWTDPVNGEEYIIMGLMAGTSFVRISPNPETPTVVAYLPSTNGISSDWRDMKVVNNHAYIVSEATGHGLQVFDLTRLRGQTSLGVVEPDFHYTRFGNAHNIVSNEATNTVFVVGATESPLEYDTCFGGLHMLDVSEPKNPQFIGCFDEDGYVHDAQCLNYNGPDSTYTGREICFCYNENSLTIVDTRATNGPTIISRVEYAGSQYTHQGWLTEDQSVLLMDDEQDEQNNFDQRTRTYIWDVNSLSNPILRNTHFHELLSIDHNQYVNGSLTYQANYAVGLRVLRIEQSTYSLSEVAYFDVYPPEDGTNPVRFNGAWSTYPWLKSGVVPVSSIEYGLYLLRPNVVAMENDYQRHLFGEQQRTSEDMTCPKQTRPCSPDAC
ncbi:unnamed protein product [Owenia fusiformis]|uniref:Uncharacterized protein n=1 Tax=Owenia fusiformis TaxID=6347 RepID=A0A8S4N2X0_OWEFU|nr:unnamed protein product [Owenia fusiformis]